MASGRGLIRREEVHFHVTKVVAHEGEPVEVLIRKFNKKVAMDGILDELKKREFYEKPSVVRKREEAYRSRKTFRKNEF